MYPVTPENPDEVELLKQRVLAHREQLRHLISDDNQSTLITAQPQSRWTIMRHDVHAD
jgi:hypothetical protein